MEQFWSADMEERRPAQNPYWCYRSLRQKRYMLSFSKR